MFGMLILSSPIFTSISIILLLFVPIYGLVISLRGFNLYLNNKLDAQVLNLTSFNISFLIIVIMGFIHVFSGNFSSKLGYFNLLNVMLLNMNLLRSRLLSFPALYFTKKHRMYLYSACNILFVISSIFILYFFVFTPVQTFTYFTNETILTIFNYLLNLTPGMGFHMSLFNIFLIIPIFIYAGLILYFDIVEKRSKRTIFADKLLLVLPFTLLVNSISTSKILFYLSPLLFFIYYFIIFFVMVSTYRTLIYRSSETSITLESYKNLIRTIAKNNIPGKNKEHIKNSIAHMLNSDNNDALRKQLFEIRWNKREKEILNEIKDLSNKIGIEKICLERRHTNECPLKVKELLEKNGTCL